MALHSLKTLRSFLETNCRAKAEFLAHIRGARYFSRFLQKELDVESKINHWTKVEQSSGTFPFKWTLRPSYSLQGSRCTLANRIVQHFAEYERVGKKSFGKPFVSHLLPS